MGIQISEHTFTLANGATDTNALPIGAETIIGLRYPAGMTADIASFTIYEKRGSTGLAMRNESGNAITITVNNNGGHVPLLKLDLSSARNIYLVAASTAAADYTLYLYTREMV
jgi:hypothetical protein